MILRVNSSLELKDFFNHNDHFYDCFIAIVDRAKDDTYKIVKQNKKCVSVLEKIYDTGYDRHLDEKILEDICQYYPHKWIWRFDSDEFLSHHFLNEMRNLPEGVIRIAMRFLSIYPKWNTFISGNHDYSSLVPVVRLESRISIDSVPRRTVAPVYVADSLMFHHHMLFTEKRAERYRLYIENNPENYSDEEKEQKYKHIIDVSSARYLPTNNSKTQYDLYKYLCSIYDSSSPDVQGDIDNLLSVLSSNRWVYL